jgi:aspartyl/asparaginyl-tRNA synthetase
MANPNIDLIEPKEYDAAVNKMREFFRSKGFIETPTQHRLSILAACEDPTTIGTYNYAGKVWPLPQTGQMWLEYELLTKPEAKGYYCVTTSYRNEANPIPGRHNLIFPMFEFETHGGLDALQKLETELMEFMGFGKASDFKEIEYADAAKHYGVEEIKAEQEAKMQNDFSTVVFLKNFPQYTSPFWNMKKEGDHARKIDVILYGIETIGSAERSTNPEEMRELFNTISDGGYANTLYAQFGKERVNAELDAFLKHTFIPRCGGGIGVTRMIRAMKLAGLIKSA